MRPYCYIALLSLLALMCFASSGQADITEAIPCTAESFKSLVLMTDDIPAQKAKIQEVSKGTAANGTPYCLVKVMVPKAINVWVGLPTGGNWNGRLQSEGGGVYCGSVGVPASIADGYVGVTTDTGHQGYIPPGFPSFFAMMDGSFGMTTPVPPATTGTANVELQRDFAYRSEHMMALIGKKVIQHFYHQRPLYSYWNGCSTGGRQGLAMVQRYPHDYDGVLAGAPAIHFDRFQAAMAWMPIVWNAENNGQAVLPAKLALATNAAVAECDDLDGVVDGVLTDPRACTYNAKKLVKDGCLPTDATCLNEAEATVINKIWRGPTNLKGNKHLWYGEVYGTDLSALAGQTPFVAATQQAKYWVYFDPNWDWKTLNYANFEHFFNYSIAQMAAGRTATDNPHIGEFRGHGGKLLLWHGFADQLIMPEGTIDYYDRVVDALGGGYHHVDHFARLFMAPGVAHCSGGAGPQPQGMFEALVNWVEKHIAPDTILASQTINGKLRTRPLCPYPAVAVWTGHGDSDDAANYVCRRGRDHYPSHHRQMIP